MGAASTEADANTADVPEALSASFAFPYVFGPGFVDALVRSGGNAAVDAALRRPPRTDAEVIDPQRYLAHIAPVIPPVSAVGTGEHLVDKPAAFGEMAALEMLSARVGYVSAWKALEGWRGDLAAPFVRDGRQCMAVVTAFDRPAHASAFAGVAQDWAATATDGSIIASGSTVQLEACDPGPNAAAPPIAGPSGVEMLELRAGFVHTVTEAMQQVSPGAAACIADRAIAEVGVEGFVQLAQASSDAVPPATAAALTRASEACRNSA